MNIRTLGALVGAWTLLAPLAAAQPLAPPTPPSDQTLVTVLSQPSDVRLSFRGPMAYAGTTPLELPMSLVGRFSVHVAGRGIAGTQGVLVLPSGGQPPVLSSEPPGMSAGLLLRALNAPGIPDITARRTMRGMLFSLAGAGGIAGGLKDHIQYRDRLDEFGPYAAARATDERRARKYWTQYVGAVWAASAVDYMIRPRMDLRESSPTRVTLTVPTVSRRDVLWRSLLVPGAGQTYANRNSRGALWLGASLAAGAGLVIANARVDRTQTNVNWTRTLIDSAGPSERPVLQRLLEVQKNDLQEDTDARRGFGLALAALWAANFIDAAIMTISEPGAKPARLQASVPIGPDGAAVSLRYRF